jgi:hypothetical protein
MHPTDTRTGCELSVFPSVSKLANIINETASNAASNSGVPPPKMWRVLATAIRSGATSEINNALREIDLVGQKRDNAIVEVVVGAVHYEDYAFLNKLLNTQDPHSDDSSTSVRRFVDVNKLPDGAIVYAILNTKTVEAVEMFLDAGLDVQKTFKTGENNDVDAVVWALKLKSPRLMSQVLAKGGNPKGKTHIYKPWLNVGG